MYETILTKEFLYEELVVKNKPKMQLANELKTSVTIINKYIKQVQLVLPIKFKPITDLKNKQYNRWTVISQIPKIKGKPTKWLCKCECGNEKEIVGSSLLNNSSKSCGCLKHELNFKGYEQINHVFWANIIESALKRNIDFNLKIEDAWNLYIKQDKKCAISGQKIEFVTHNDRQAYQTASLDRIKNSEGYTIDNIQWVHKQINFLKGVLSDEELFFWSKEVYLNNQEKEIVKSIPFRIWGKNSKNARFLPIQIESNFKDK